MDNNISLQVKRLIELDRKAVELEDKREHELKELEHIYAAEKETISLQLKLAKEEAKSTYENLVEQAQKEAETIRKLTNQKLQELEQKVSQEVELIAMEWWEKILRNLK